MTDETLINPSMMPLESETANLLDITKLTTFDF